MVEASLYGPTEYNMKDNLPITESQDTESTNGQTEVFIKAKLKMA